MKFYTKPEIEISVFSTEDIITASNVTGGDDTATGLTEVAALGEDTADAKYSDLF